MRGTWYFAAVAAMVCFGAAGEEARYNRLLVTDDSDEPGVRAVLMVDVGAGTGFEPIAKGKFAYGIACVARGTALLSDDGGLGFLALATGELQRFKLPGYPIGCEVGGGRVFLVTSSGMQVIDIASRSSREIALPDVPAPGMELRLEPSPDGRRAAFCMQHRERIEGADGWVAKPQYDVIVADADTGKSRAMTTVTWFDSPFMSVRERGPRIAWLDRTTLVTLSRADAAAPAKFVRVDVESGAVEEGPELPAEAMAMAEPRLTAVGGSTPPVVEIRGAGRDFVLNPRTWEFLDEAQAPGFRLTRVTGGSEVRYNGQIIDRESGPECIRSLAVSPDGKRAAWTADQHFKGRVELRCYDADEGEVRSPGLLGRQHSRFFWVSAEDLTRATPPPQPPPDWKPLELE